MDEKEYTSRVIALFRSGKATPAQEREMTEAIFAAGEEGADKLTAIHKGIGYCVEDCAEVCA